MCRKGRKSVQATRAVWVNLQRSSEPAAQLDRAATALSPLVTQIVHNRGIAAEALGAFLRPPYDPDASPLTMLGMRAALDRLLLARERRETVAVYGDFDVDGITGTAVLVEALSASGVAALPYIPHRQSEGSGLHEEAVASLAAQGVRLIVTVDCGITNAVEVNQVMRSGLDVIVTDHHSPPDILPRAVAIVDPRQPGCPYPFKELAGVGVAFRLAQVLLRATRGDHLQLEQRLLDLVAIGTIADMVALRGENRALVWFGLRALNDTERPGLQALIARSGLRMGAITSTDVGFRICPRLNAAGRLDHASLGYELLRAASYEHADSLAQRLEEKNTERQQLTKQALADAHARLAAQPDIARRRLLVLEVDAWAAGVLGLLAGKLVEETGKPVVVLQRQDGEVRGSARGTPAFSMLDALRTCEELLDRYGGHQLAAGFTTAPDRLPALIARLQQHAAASLVEGDVRPVLEIDAEVTSQQITWSLYDQLQALEPCGVGNPLPLFLCRRVRLGDVRTVGNNHLRLSIGKGNQRLTALVFRRGDLAPYLRRNMDADLVFHLEANDWNGYRTLQLRVRDMQFEPAYNPSLNLDLEGSSRRGG